MIAVPLISVYTGWAKSQLTEEKIEYLCHSSAKWADFLPVIEVYT